MPHDVQQRHGAVAVLHTRGRDHDGQAPSERLDEEMPCAPRDLWVRLKAAAPPVSAVLTDCLSRRPALGGRCRPAAPRTSPRSWACITCQVPSCCQRQQSWETSCHGGKSWGSRRHAQPPRRRYKMPFRISRLGYFSGRPPGVAVGPEGAINAYSLSVRAVGYGVRGAMPPRVIQSH